MSQIQGIIRGARTRSLCLALAVMVMTDLIIIQKEIIIKMIGKQAQAVATEFHNQRHADTKLDNMTPDLQSFALEITLGAHLQGRASTLRQVMEKFRKNSVVTTGTTRRRIENRLPRKLTSKLSHLRSKLSQGAPESEALQEIMPINRTSSLT